MGPARRSILASRRRRLQPPGPRYAADPGRDELEEAARLRGLERARRQRLRGDLADVPRPEVDEPEGLLQLPDRPPGDPPAPSARPGRGRTLAPARPPP